MRRRRRTAALLRALTAAVLALAVTAPEPAAAMIVPAATTAEPLAAEPSAVEPSAATGTEPAAAVSGGPIKWKPCPGVPAADCGTVNVPIDWSKPHGATIDLAVARRKASDPAARIGSLLVDPGGPGASGVDWVTSGSVFSSTVHRRFDVVGFDPRGVGASHPVQCDYEAASDAVPVLPRSQVGFDQMAARNKALGDSCRARTGPLFDFVDTTSVARDLDAIRAALRERKVTYYGVSYGTLIGERYAELFPYHVRAMVLDSAMDHSLTSTGQFLQTASVGPQESFGQFVAWCDRTAVCALHGQDVRQVFADLYERAGRGELNLPGLDIRIDPLLLLNIANGHLYGPDWRPLADFLSRLVTGQPGPSLAQRRSVLSGPGRDRRDQPVEEPFRAVFCQDWRLPVHRFADLETYRRDTGLVAPDMRLSPLAWSATLSCVGWPSRVRNPQHRLSVRGAPPILVINSRYDPATPHQWATNVAHQMGAVLLTYDGWGHGAYFKGSDCVTGTADRYLISRTAPKPGTHCPAVEPPSAPGTPSPGQPHFPAPGGF
jgi:pimeloyl-ACP methyl ester carboxylesterase